MYIEIKHKMFYFAQEEKNSLPFTQLKFLSFIAALWEKIMLCLDR